MSKLTFQDQYTLATEISGSTDTVSLIKFKRDINMGGAKFLAGLGREYNRHSRFADVVSGQQYYQSPEDMQKVKEIIVSNGAWNPPMEQIPDEFGWRMMNMLSISGMPTHYWVRGNNEFGLYPIPAATVTKGIELVFSPKHIQLTSADYTTGTVTVSNGSINIQGAGTVFTTAMVGQWLQTTDGTDENFYKISNWNSATSIDLENYYQGTSGGTKTFRIGQVMDLPDEFLEGPVDYAMYRFYLKRGNPQLAADFKALFQDALDNARDTYGNTTESQVVQAEPTFRFYNPFRGDPPSQLTS